ncbi:OmpA family protein [Aureispira sp. CCB-QB1]|uniref:OmpA family protein n=1 Tax=Aureispira sp. CCB-QB1 TaxID=1313421 RepID=UPI0006986D20|nr:OmpA family protein [Aureispira sp. CCB-QB1]
MKIIHFFILVFIHSALIAQNLVVNPSFEEGAVCDGSTERIDTVNGWSTVAGNPGYINTNCFLSKESKAFVQGMRLPPASEGQVLSIQKFDIKTECQQSSLSQPLEAGKQYVVQMRVRLPIQFCQQPINEVGVVLSKTPLDKQTERGVLDLPALSLQNNTQTPITKQYEWEEISTIYTAEGGEQFIAIGNFSSNNKGVFENRTKKECTYLFIDVVSVSEFKEQTLVPYTPNMVLKKDQRLLLKEIEFETGSDVLKKSSFTILKTLAKTLKENPNIKIEIISYTHNSLDPTESLTFTKARAKAIAKWLENQEVLGSQLKPIGRGSANAIALNNSKNERQKNERIEIRFIEL